jgi:enamine deaminase RidA (YjgF/YER057c/UK114 family)
MDMTGRIDARLAELNITLPAAGAPLANYVPYVVAGNLVHLAGQISRFNDEPMIVGRLGGDVSIEDGQRAARWCGLNLIAHLRTACAGDLDRVTRCVRLGGFVNSAPEFTDQPKIINGCSDLMVEVFGDAGRHARAAVGVNVLPFNVAVEIDAVFEIRI